MEEDYQKYFETKKNYHPKAISKYLKIQEDILTLSERIRDTANYTLSGEISPNNGKKEISDLIKTINKLKRNFG